MKQTFCRTCCRLLKASSNQKKQNKKKRVHAYLSNSVPLRALYACTQCLPIFSFALKFGETPKRVWEFLLYLVTYFSQTMISLRLVQFISILIRKRFLIFTACAFLSALRPEKQQHQKNKKKWKTNFTLTCSFQKVIRTRRFK